MSLLKKISRIFKSPSTSRDYWFYVQCNRCKEIIKGRVDLYNHLSIQYGEGKDENTYYCRKVLIGGKRCFRSIEVEFTFDSNRRLLDQKIKNAVFVSEVDYLSSLEEPG